MSGSVQFTGPAPPELLVQLVPAKYGQRLALRVKNLAAGLAILAARLNDVDGANVAHLPKKFNRAAILTHRDGIGVPSLTLIV
jgi:hypothetical protein